MRARMIDSGRVGGRHTLKMRAKLHATRIGLCFSKIRVDLWRIFDSYVLFIEPVPIYPVFWAIIGMVKYSRFDNTSLI